MGASIKLRVGGKAVLGNQTYDSVSIMKGNEMIGTAYRRRDAMYLFEDEVMSRTRLIEKMEAR